MGTYHLIQRNVLDESGNFIDGAQITVRNTSDNSVASVWSDEGVTPVVQPFSATGGAFSVYVRAGEYSVTADDGINTQTFEFVVGNDKYLFDTRADWIAAAAKLPVGSVAEFDGQSVKKTGAGTAIPDAAGWVPTSPFAVPQHFGAAGDGVADDTAAVQAAADYLGTVALAGEFNWDATNGSALNWSGQFRLTGKITWKNALSADFGGPNQCIFLVDHTDSEAFQIGPDDPLDDQPLWAGVWLENFAMRPLQDVSATTDAIRVRKCSYGSGLRNVVITLGTGDPSHRFKDHFRIERSWTFRLVDCNSTFPLRHHINQTDSCGEIFVDHGRYDAAGDHGWFSDSIAGELTCIGSAIQFGNKSAIKTTTGYSVTLRGTFLEGNCIGSPSEYYLDLAGGGTSLTSVVVDNVVFNNLADANRNGAGVMSVSGYRDFYYKPRWTRNTQSRVPLVGTGVENVDLILDNAEDPAPALSQVAAANDNFVRMFQRNRPSAFYGMDMNGGPSVNPEVRAAITAGLDGIGVAMGTYDSAGALQAYGASNAITLNPNAGTVFIGRAGARVESGTNELLGRLRIAGQGSSSSITPLATTGYVLIDCTAGGRTVNLANIPAAFGREIVIGKSDTTTNALTITPASGTINGAATLVLNTSRQHVRLIANNTDWFIV